MSVIVRRAVSTDAGRWLFGLAWGVYFFTAGGIPTARDAVIAFEVTRNIVEHGTVATPGYHSPSGVLQSLYNIPFYVAGSVFVQVSGITAGRPDRIPQAFVALAQVFVSAAIVWQIFWLSLIVTRSEHAAALAALTAGFGSILWPYAKFGFNQPLACATLAAAVISVLLGVRRKNWRPIVMGGLWLAASLMTRHEMVIAALPIGIWLLVSPGDRATGIRRLAAFAPGVLAGVATWLGFNYYRFGTAFDSAYLRDGTPEFGGSVLHGLAGLLFSPGESLFLYSPVAVVGAIGLVKLSRTDRSVVLLLSSVTITFVLFYATLGDWSAGSWGSRYLVVVVPYLAVGWAGLLADMERRLRVFAMVIVTTIGLVVQLPGVVVDSANVSQAAPAAFTTAERQWRWEASPLVLNTRAMLTAVPANVDYFIGSRTVPRVARPSEPNNRGLSQPLAFSLDFWWLYLFYLGLLTRIMVGLLLGAFALWVVVCCQGLGGELA